MRTNYKLRPQESVILSGWAIKNEGSKTVEMEWIHTSGSYSYVIAGGSDTDIIWSALPVSAKAAINCPVKEEV